MLKLGRRIGYVTIEGEFREDWSEGSTTLHGLFLRRTVTLGADSNTPNRRYAIAEELSSAPTVKYVWIDMMDLTSVGSPNSLLKKPLAEGLHRVHRAKNAAILDAVLTANGTWAPHQSNS